MDAVSRLVTDNGSAFRAKKAMAIYEALDIQKEWILNKQSWENLMESHFSMMRRLSNEHFEQVTSWEGAKQTHRRADRGLHPATALGTPQA
jgi:hypothetical protein